MKIRLIEDDMSGNYRFKPLNRNPETPMGKQVTTDIKRQNAVRGLSEFDVNLSEEEKSRKKKIFKLAKMEALVHNDDKLTSIFKKILEDNPEEKYGYHWNETVMNILFNDYVLNNSVYFEKYKNAIPVEKKRRDRSAINALMNDDGDEDNNDDNDSEQEMKMAAESDMNEINLFGGGSFDTSGWFVQPQSFKPNDLLVFNKKNRSLIDIISHQNLAQQITKYKALVNQGIELVDPAGTTAQNLKAILSNYKVPKEIVGTLKNILASKAQNQTSPALSEYGEDSGGQDLHWGMYKNQPQTNKQPLPSPYDVADVIADKIVNAEQGGFEKQVDQLVVQYFKENAVADFVYRKIMTNEQWWEQLYDALEQKGKMLQETTTSASSGQYSQPAIWAKDKSNMRFARKPAWSGGQIVGESYITDPKCFAEYAKSLEIDDMLNEMYDQAEAAFAEATANPNDVEKQNLIKALKNVLSNAVKRVKLEDDQYKQNFLQVIDDIKRELLSVDPNALDNDQHLGENMGEEQRPEKLQAINPQQAEELFNKGIVIYMHIDDQPVLSMDRNLMSLRKDAWDGSMNIYRNNMTPEQYGFQNIIQWLKSKGVDPKWYTFNSTQTWIPDEQRIEENNDQQVIQQIMKDINTQGGAQQPQQPQRPDNTKQWSGSWNENLDEYSFDDDNMHFADVTTRGRQEKIRLDQLVKFARTNPSMDQITAYAAGLKMTPEKIAELAQSYLGNNLGYSGGSYDTPEQEALVNLVNTIEDASAVQEPEMATQNTQDDEEDVAPATQPFTGMDESMIDTPDMSMSLGGSQASSIANKDGESGMSMGANVDDISHQTPSTLSLSTTDGGDDLTMGNDIMNENKQHPSQTNLDRIKKENEKNTKAYEKQADGLKNDKVYGFDPETAGTKDIIKAAQFPADKDFYIKHDETDEVSFEDLENAATKVGKTGIDPKKQVKRILTPEEEKALLMNRGEGMGDIVYDNKPSQKFEDRMKQDMGDDQYKIRLDKMKMKAGMPMYNKETQPTGGEHADNKFAKKYNTEDMNESISGSYFDSMGKRRIVEFKIADVKTVAAIDNSYTKLEMSGFGNSITNKVYDSFSKKIHENASLKNELNTYNYFIKDSQIFRAKNTVTSINESTKMNESKTNAAFEKMKKLMNYDPSKYLKK